MRYDAPTGNAQGAYHYFYSLTSGWVLNHNHWNHCPCPPKSSIEFTLQTVGAGNPGLNFTDCLGDPFVDLDDDDSDDESYIPEQDNDQDDHQADEDENFSYADDNVPDVLFIAGVYNANDDNNNNEY